MYCLHDICHGNGARRGGTGLGLALCRHFIEAGHGGTIGAHSRVGDGSEFYFEVPLTFAMGETPPLPRAMSTGSAISMACLVVLIALAGKQSCK